jgi:hypothetical protein
VLVPGRPDQTSIWVAIADVQLENPNQRAFLSAFERTGCIGWAAQAAKIGRKSHYRWLQNDADSAAAFKQAQMIAGDTLQGVAFERALVGWTQPVFFRGEKCGEVRRYDNAMLMFLLRALKPEVYGARVRVPAPAIAAPPAQPPRKVEVVFRNAAEDDSARKSSSVERQESFFHSTVEPENSISTAASMTPEAASASRRLVAVSPPALSPAVPTLSARSEMPASEEKKAEAQAGNSEGAHTTVMLPEPKGRREERPAETDAIATPLSYPPQEHSRHPGSGTLEASSKAASAVVPGISARCHS